MNDAELKLLKARESLLMEISQLKNQIHFCITNGANRIRKEVFEGKLNNWPESISLTKEEYTNLLDYLSALEKDNITLYKPYNYMGDYYTFLQIKNDLLSKL